MKATIRLTPDSPIGVKKSEIVKSICSFTLKEDSISYNVALDYPSNAYIDNDGTGLETPIKFQFKKYETGVILRKHLVGIAKTSYTEVNPDTNEAVYVHMLLIESSKSQFGLTCTYEERNKYYPYLEDYYKGGDKWKELIEK